MNNKKYKVTRIFEDRPGYVLLSSGSLQKAVGVYLLERFWNVKTVISVVKG